MIQTGSKQVYPRVEPLDELRRNLPRVISGSGARQFVRYKIVGARNVLASNLQFLADYKPRQRVHDVGQVLMSTAEPFDV